MNKNLAPVFFALAVLLAGCATNHNANSMTLKDACKNDFLIGAALNESEFTGQNSNAVAIIKTQFNTISPENVLKWESVHPRPGEFDFTAADRYVEFGQKNKMFIIGHNLIWHNQTPRWVFQDDQGNPLGRDALLARMWPCLDLVDRVGVTHEA
jgi:endo-1,4-beta-xylanase